EGELKVKEVSSVQSFSANFLTNPLLYSNDFFADNCFWSLSSGSTNSFKAINDISSKNKVLQINKSDSTNIDFYQTIRYLPGGNYKLYFDIKIDDASANFTSSNFKARVTVTYTKSKLSTGISDFAIIKPEIETITKTYEQTLSSVNFKGWQRIEKDLIEVPEESSTIYNIRVKVEFILSGNNYILYLNNIGFSKYPYAVNSQNLLTNGYFNFDGNDWLNVSLAPVDGIKSLNYDDLHGKIYGFNCIKLTGNISS
ncbi:MAG: hypothetical protein SOV26_02450, partial [Candidatus Onthovivens sp.]|nr:hypothetical protein [Candidatus Onthovivens sp.]